MCVDQNDRPLKIYFLLNMAIWGIYICSFSGGHVYNQLGNRVHL